MVILPIVHKNHILNVEIRLKNVEKVRSGVKYDDALESDIIINSNKFSESSFNIPNDISAEVDFVRSKSLLNKSNSFLITTKVERDSDVYDIYEVSNIPKKVNDNLDKLYSRILTDIRKKIPKVRNRGKYVSLKKLGIDKTLTSEKIALLQRIIKDHRDQSEWPLLFNEAGIMDVKDTVDFIDLFDCVIISETTIPEDSFLDTLKVFGNINTREYKNLNNYYKMAINNTEIFTRLSYIHKLLYGKPLVIIQSNQKPKQLYKKKDEVEKKVDE